MDINQEITLKEFILTILDEREKQLHMTRTELERRLEQMNELRAQLTNERGSFVTLLQHDLVQDSIKDLQIWRGNIEGRMLVVGAVVVIFNLALNALTCYLLWKR